MLDSLLHVLTSDHEADREIRKARGRTSSRTEAQTVLDSLLHVLTSDHEADHEIRKATGGTRSDLAVSVFDFEKKKAVAAVFMHSDPYMRSL